MPTIQHALRSLMRSVGLAAVIAVVAVLTIHSIGSNVFDASMEVTVGDEPSSVGAGLAAGFTLAFAVLGGVAAALLARYVGNPSRMFTIIAAVIFVLMAFGPITAADDGATTVTLLAMHVAVLVSVLALVLPALRGLETSSNAEAMGSDR